MKYLHTMVRVSDIEKSLEFYCEKLGLKQIKRVDRPEFKYSLIFIAPEGQEECPLELTYNWESEEYNEGRNFGHVAYEVDDIYALCQRLINHGVAINRPPRDGKMAFIRSPDNISIELLQKGEPLEVKEPWKSMENIGKW
ncbi:MAG: lactoylglutathione lyase [Gammaproteobacteria bacterium TMED78]|nr:MAG: lactoylglutathione lyase [Gammaproteobacteria bacterium TMED78]|tara:strand:- start:570 stop:989 length:420 start_codon:yes stop_codon:yes gene_type:complete